MKTTSWFSAIAAFGIARPVGRMGGTRPQVMTLRMIVGVLAAGLMAAGPDLFSIAAAVFLLGFMLARADGEMARLAKEDSVLADRYAAVSDVGSIAMAFVGLGAGLQAGAAELKIAEFGFPDPIFMGIVCAVAVVSVSWLAQRLEVIDGRRSPEFDSLLGFDVGDIALVIPIALWIGWCEGLLVVAAFGGAAFAGGIYMAHFRKLHHLT